jgi:hypothetical protein
VPKISENLFVTTFKSDLFYSGQEVVKPFSEKYNSECSFDKFINVLRCYEAFISLKCFED